MTTKTSHSNGTLPRKEADLNYVITSIFKTWSKHPEIILPWTTPAEFKIAITSFGTSFEEREDVKGSRRGITQEMRLLNKEIDESIEFLKHYLIELYSRKEAIAHYQSMGIVKNGGKYRLPMDGEKRLYALTQVLKGVDEHALDDRKYGTAYWTDVRDRFVAIKEGASEADKSTSSHVSVKREQKKYIRKTLNALVHIIKAYYPDTYREELRIWGLQKEKY